MANDQKNHWNTLHIAGKADFYLELKEATNFGLEMQHIIPAKAKILELGCGAGNDAFFFAKKGHTVLATDFSEIAIEKNKTRIQNENLTFQVLDINQPMPFADKTFEAVYARLSLHYFTAEHTKNIFKEIHRVLKPNGYLCFLCKSTNDPLFGKGEEIEKDMFELDGHIRHFFSDEFVKLCLDGNFELVKQERGEEKFYSRPSAFIKVVALNKR